MEVGKLTVQLRDQSGKGSSRRLRAQGLVPGVCYGAGIDAPVPICLSTKELKAALDPAKRQNTVIDVTLEKDGKADRTITAMLWEYQVHPIKQVVTHVDLKAIDPELQLEAEVPVELSGKHAGAIDGGILSFARRQATVRAKPANIPSKLVLDITSLNIGEALHLSDIPLPEGVEYVDSPKLTVVTCVAPRGGVETTTTAAEGEAPAEGEAKKEG